MWGIKFWANTILMAATTDPRVACVVYGLGLVASLSMGVAHMFYNIYDFLVNDPSIMVSSITPETVVSTAPETVVSTAIPRSTPHSILIDYLKISNNYSPTYESQLQDVVRFKECFNGAVPISNCNSAYEHYLRFCFLNQYSEILAEIEATIDLQNPDMTLAELQYKKDGYIKHLIIESYRPFWSETIQDAYSFHKGKVMGEELSKVRKILINHCVLPPSHE